jgi:hypothetical protein
MNMVQLGILDFYEINKNTITSSKYTLNKKNQN